MVHECVTQETCQHVLAAQQAHIATQAKTLNALVLDNARLRAELEQAQIRLTGAEDVDQLRGDQRFLAIIRFLRWQMVVSVGLGLVLSAIIIYTLSPRLH